MTCPPPAPSDVLALDIGGANLKAADGTGWTRAEPFAMWREWERLTDAVGKLIADRRPRRLVVTMTGEIADCFPDRAAGVAHIVSAVASAANAHGCGPADIYRIDGKFVSPEVAVADPLSVAASNWHAVARLAAAQAGHDRAFLVDIGSTTTDIVPLAHRRPAPLASDDAGRMLSGELVYTGVERTPLAAIVRSLPHGTVRRPIASEKFAESRDAWLLRGELTADAASHDTADGGPFTRAAAHIRIARSMLLEPNEVSPHDADRAAAWVAEAQARQVARALARVARGRGWLPEAVVLSGHGDQLAQMAVARMGWTVDLISLPARLGLAVSRSAPAHALALIACGGLP